MDLLLALEKTIWTTFVNSKYSELFLPFLLQILDLLLQIIDVYGI